MLLRKPFRKADDENFRLQTGILLRPAFDDYHFVLSFHPRQGFLEIEGLIQVPSTSRVPFVENALSGTLMEKAYFFYSSRDAVLMVKARGKTDLSVLFHVMVLKTAFKYYIKNF